MLGTEPQIVAEYVQSGRVKIVFWPVLNHGNPSVYSTLAAECAGQQDPALFWSIHEVLFSRQGELWGADRDFYVNLAEGVGADRETFAACYDGTDGLDRVMTLDALRRERGIFSQPTFDINGTIYAGAPSFPIFSETLDDILAAG